MPFLPESIWKRRLESEYAELQLSGAKFEASSDKTIYTITLFTPAFKESEEGNVEETSFHQVRIELKREFPYAGGIEVTWLTPIFHPNIREEDGRVCIQLLNQWGEMTSLKNIVEGLKQLLSNPNPASPLNKKAADFFLRNPRALNASRAGAPSVPRIISVQ